MFVDLCSGFLKFGWWMGISFGAVSAWLWTRYIYRRQLDAVLSEFRRATNKPALTLEQLVDEVKRLATPIAR